MRRNSRHARLKSLLRIREALSVRARADLVGREDEMTEARRLEDRAIEHRDGSLSSWRELLGRSSPDLGLVRLSGAWLLDTEAALAGARLDSSIVESRRQEAAKELALAKASETATRSTHMELARRLARKLEDKRQSELSDSLLPRMAR